MKIFCVIDLGVEWSIVGKGPCVVHPKNYAHNSNFAMFWLAWVSNDGSYIRRDDVTVTSVIRKNMGIMSYIHSLTINDITNIIPCPYFIAYFVHSDGIAQCQGISNANALEIPWPCAKPSICGSFISIKHFEFGSAQLPANDVATKRIDSAVHAVMTGPVANVWLR